MVLKPNFAPLRKAALIAWRAAAAALERTARFVRASGWRLRASTAGVVLVLVVVTWLGLETASAARDARAEISTLITEASGLTIPGLVEPATYARLAEQSRATLEALKEVDSRLDLLAPIEFIPVIGDRIKEARNTIDTGAGLASAAAAVLTAYGDALDGRRLGGSAEAASALEAQRASLEDALTALDRAQALADGPLVLSDEERGLLIAGISVLRSLAVVAIEAPNAVDDGFTILEIVQSLQLLLNDPLTAITDTSEAKSLIDALRSRTAALTGHLESLSDSSDDTVALALNAIAIVGTTSEAAGKLISVADELGEGLFSQEFGANVGPKLLDARDRLAEARRLLSDLETEFTSGLGSTLGDSGPLAGSASAFAPAEQILAQTESAVEAIRSLLGYDTPRTYLLLMQNQNEIRATGGFLGATAEFPLSNGVLGPLTFLDSTQIDIPPLINNPPAPEPLFWYLWMGRLLFRDANWNPDFPTSAETLLEFYEDSRQLEADGAFTGTKLLALDLVDVVGTIKVEGLDEPITRAQADEYVEGLLSYRCEDRHVSKRSKRCFDEDLLPALLSELRSGLTEERRAGLIEVVTSHLERKNILLYSRDQVVQDLLTSNGWAGEIGSPSQDLLMVIDSSLPGHTTSQVQRTLNYTVRLVPGGTSKADLLIRLENDRPPIVQCRQAEPGGGGCYWNYIRVLLSPTAINVDAPSVPLHEGSEKLTWGHRELETSQIVAHAGAGLGGLTEVGGYIVVEPQHVLTMPISYDLGADVVRSTGGLRHEYRLRLLKQSGIDNDQVTVRVLLPEGSEVIAGSPGDFVASGTTVSWHLELTQDAEIVLAFKTP